MTPRRTLRLRAMLIAAVVVGSAALVPAPAAAVDPTDDPFADRTTVLFSSPVIPSGCYRIPALVRAVDGSLLAFAERRLNTCADKSNIATVVRRLPAGATEWLPAETVMRGEPGDPLAPATRGNPGPVVYRKLPGAPDANAPDGRIVLLGTHNPVDPATPGMNHRTASRTPYVLHSDDNGVTWTEPRTLHNLDDPTWGHYATAPVHAIQLTRGEHVGRLVAGVNFDPGEGFGAMLVYSDDAGVTWHRGARVDLPPSMRLVPQELSLVEKVNGDILVWTRQNNTSGTPEEEADPNIKPHRAIAISKDGGETFSSGFTLVPGFEAPNIQSSSLRLGATDDGDRFNRILTLAPSVNVQPRIRPTIRATFDEGLSWQGVDTPAHTTDEGVQIYGTNDRSVPAEECGCFGGYGDMVELPGGDVGVLYERGVTDYRSEIVFIRLNDRDLHTPATTPDVPGRSALVFDGVARAAGRFGGAFTFDGEQGRVQLPYRTTPVLPSGDFTVATWIKYDDATADQAIFWANGIHGQPQVWLRAEPGSDRIRATVTTPTGTASVTTDAAYADDAWHHIVLQRHGDIVSLHVDGEQVGSAPGAAGAVHGDDPTPIYLGQRLDGANRFHGAMDEFRIYDHALTDPEIDLVRTTNRTNLPGLTAHLPMNAIVPAAA